MRRSLCLLSLVLALPLQAEEKVVNLYSWADYVAPQTLQRFEQDTGYKVRYDTFDTPEVLETKLLTGGSGYDVVVPSSTVLARALKANALQPLNAQAMPGYGNLDKDLLGKLAEVDPGNRHAVPYTWGTLGLGVNVEAVRQRLGDVPLDSLDLLFKPEYATRLKGCGIALPDSPQEVIGVALNYLGKDPYSQNKDDLAAAQNLLSQLQPSVSYVANGRQINDLANGAQVELRMPLTVELHGKEHSYNALLLATRLDERRFQVVTQEPLMLRAEDFDLLPGVETLRKLAGLKSISPSVPVNAVLIFTAR